MYGSKTERMIGMWTGERWWSTEGEIHPVRWELQVREKKTQKLLKKLPKNELPVRAEDSALRHSAVRPAGTP